MSYYPSTENCEVIKGLSFEDYLKIDRPNQSLLKSILTSSEKHAKLNQKKESPALKTGNEMHSLVLEGVAPKDPKELYHIYNGQRRGDAWKLHVKEAEVREKEPTTMADYKNLYARFLDTQSAFDAIPPQALEMLANDGNNELTILFDFVCVDDGYTIPFKVRIDSLKEHITDYKSTSMGVGRRQVQNSIGKYFYDLQAAAYQSGAMAAFRESYDFYWVFQEPTKPYDCGIYKASDECLANGYSWLYDGLRRYQYALESGVWKGAWSGKVEDIEGPDWHQFEPELITEGVKEVSAL